MQNAKASSELEWSDIPLLSQTIEGKGGKNILVISLLTKENNLNF